MIKTYHTLQDAYWSMLTALHMGGERTAPILDPTSVGSTFGTAPRATVEMLCSGFTLSNPRARLLKSKSRRVNLTFAVANTIWTLRGTDDVESIAFYNPRGRLFSHDGMHFAGSVGRRIFDCDGRSQIEAVRQTLLKDPASRRALVQIFTSGDLFSPPLDTPCTAGLQFFIRNGALQCLTYMRSQSVLMLLPYDVFLFTMLQEAVAVSLGLEVGSYYHVCGSFHYYFDEAALVEQVLQEETGPIAEMERMKSSPVLGEHPVFVAESDIRHRLSIDPTASIAINDYELDEYWRDLVALLVIGVRKLAGQDPTATDLDAVSEAYRPWL